MRPRTKTESEDGGILDMSSGGIVSLRRIFSVTSGATPASDRPEFWNGEILWVTPEDLSGLDGYWLRTTNRKITARGYESCGTTIVPAESIVLSKRAPIGQLALLAKPACSNQGCFLLSPRDGVDPRFFYFWLSSRVDYLLHLGQGSTFMELSADDLKEIRVPCPPTQIQRRIADYLDRETARLDALVAEQQRLLDLLTEKRHALIAYAVTRGIHRPVTFRDSNVEWLGYIPRHWDTKRARWLFRERDHRSATGSETLLTVSHLTGVTPRSEKEVNMFEARSTKGYKRCFPGDLVINTLWAWMGAMGVAAEAGIVSPAYNVYEPAKQIDPAYIDALVRLRVFAQEATRHSKGVWSSRLRLYPDGFFAVMLPVPPLSEQREIVAFLTNEGEKLDRLIDATSDAINLIEERRAVLIESAIMGGRGTRHG